MISEGLVSRGEGGCYPSDHKGHGGNPPKFTWPNGARVAVQFVLNYEEGGENTILNGDEQSEVHLTETPGNAPKIGARDLSTESCFEYGSRCGVWRVLNLFKEKKLPITIYAVGKALEKNPDVGRRCIEDGHEIACHHHRWIDFDNMNEEKERGFIRSGIQAIQNATGGVAPVGWYTGRQSINHRKILVEEFHKLGLPLKYDADAYNDDLPYYVEISPAPGISPKPHLVVPYTLEVNDMKFGKPPGFTSPEGFFQYLRDAFITLEEETRQYGHGVMMSVGLHARIVGRPGRFQALRRFVDFLTESPNNANSNDSSRAWVARRSDIADFWWENFPPPSTT